MIFEKLEKNTRAGFTLIELLVVVGIISIISSIVVGQVSDARIKARNSAILQSAYQLTKALELYAADHDGLYPGESLGNNQEISQSKYLLTNGSYHSYSIPGEFNLSNSLSPYLDNVLESPVSSQQYIYAVPNKNNQPFPSNSYVRCSDQTDKPRYLIALQKIDGFEANLPLLVSQQTIFESEEDEGEESSIPVPVISYYCISAPI